MAGKSNPISPKFEINRNMECTIIDNTHETIAPEVDAKLSKVRITNSDAKLKISSKNWLKRFGLKASGLNSISLYPKLGFPRVEDFNKALQKPIQSKYGDNLFPRHFREDGITFNIVAKKEKILDAQQRLKSAVDLYKQRLQWLKTESRRIFGVVEEHVVTIIIDVNNKVPREFDHFICALERLLNEQIRYCLKFNLIRAQDTTLKFSSRCQTVTKDSINAGIDWLWEIDKTASVNPANLVEAVIRANNDSENEAIYLITEASSSDGSREVLRNKIHQLKIPFHIVAYNCVDDNLLNYFQDLTQITGGRLHTYVFDMSIDSYEAPPAYSVGAGASLIHRRRVYGNCRGGISTRQDCMEVFEELEEAKNLLDQVENIIEKIPDTHQYEKREHEDMNRDSLEPIKPDKPNQQSHQTQEEYMTSEEWLKRFGLNSRKLDFYDVLAGVCFRHCDGVVDVLEPPRDDEIDWMEQQNATHHKKLINARYCDKFAHVLWKDGSLVHVQISSDVHRLYHQRMQLCLSAIQRRIDWLRQGSRELFGTISEQNICLVVDTSASMIPQIEFVKQKLFCLLQEQLRHKQKMNMIAFNTKVVPWRDRLVDVTETNMESVWRWAESLSCQGSTNTLAALQFALKDRSTQGIYFLTDGRPDQPPQTVLAQMRLMQQNRVPVHCISFNCADREANRFLWDLARESGGRFHYFNEVSGDEVEDDGDENVENGSSTGIEAWESEDIRLLKAEYARGTEYLEKLTKLRDECHQLAWKKEIDLKKRGENREKLLPRFNTSMGGSCGKNSMRNKNKIGRQKIRARNTMKRELDKRKPDAKDKRIWEGDIKLLEFDQPRHESEAYVSFLQNFIGNQNLQDDWVMPETRNILDRQTERYKKIIEDEKRQEEEEEEACRQKGNETNRKSHRDLSLRQWLNIYGLAPQQMAILDVLAPTVVNVKPHYVPILDQHVVSRVFTDILPISYVTTKKSSINEPNGGMNIPVVKLVNPMAVNLAKYQKELSVLLNKYHKKLTDLVKRHICNSDHCEKLDEFDAIVNEQTINSFDVKQWVMNEFAAVNWPEHEDDLELLFRDIKLGDKYMLQADELIKHGNEHRKSDGKSSSNSKQKKPQTGKSQKLDKKQRVQSRSLSRSAVIPTETKQKKPPTIENDLEIQSKKVHYIAPFVDNGMYYEVSLLEITKGNIAQVYYNGLDVFDAIPFNQLLRIPGLVDDLMIGSKVLVRVTDLDSKKTFFLPGTVTKIKYNNSTKLIAVSLFNKIESFVRNEELVGINNELFNKIVYDIIEKCNTQYAVVEDDTTMNTSILFSSIDTGISKV